MAARAVGGHDGLRQARIRFLGNVFAGDRLECTGVIHEVTPDAQRMTLRCRAEADGRPVADMDATFLLDGADAPSGQASRSEEHTSELQSLMRISYAVFCLKKKKKRKILYK